MNIGLIGYGKMGKAIEAIALERGHHIVLRANSNWNVQDLENCDVAIEFSRPENAVENIEKCFKMNVPVAVGTTGWYSDYERLGAKAKAENKTLLTASNFSIGVNLFFKLNEYLAKLMNAYPNYEISMAETHHVHKLDAPSGTAITLAEGVLNQIDRKNKWVGQLADTKSTASEFDLNIVSHRIDEVPGTHNIKYASDIDEIEIIHTAHNRNGFALGAVIAAEWLVDKKGVFTMKDVLSL
jgi:4-hydroxy-tetrahydrodipicolinate reductase